jgi:hypothetical protein
MPCQRCLGVWLPNEQAAHPGPVTAWLDDHQRLQRERAELVATLDRLAPAWQELRAVLNDLNRVLGT